MKKLKTQWLKGFDLLDQRVNSINSELLDLETYLNVNLPIEIKQFLQKYIPKDLDNESLYAPEIKIEDWGMLYCGSLYKYKFVYAGPLYDIKEIIRRLHFYYDDTLDGIERKGLLLPIASNGINDGDIVLSLENNTIGGIYYFSDYQTDPIDESTLLANNIIDFINGIEVMPFELVAKNILSSNI